MIEEDKEEIKKKAVTTGPTAAGLVAPSKENLIEPKSKLKEMYSYENCTHCGYCRHVCKVYNYSWSETDYAGGRNRIIKGLDRGIIKFDKEEIIPAVFRCMLCGACKVVCPVGIDTLEVFQQFRERVVKKGAMPDKLKVIKKTILENNNPFMEKHDTRFSWTDKVKEGKIALQRAQESYKPGKGAKVGYFVGCTSSYRNAELAIATSTVMGKLNVDFQLFPEEKCCGSLFFRTGLKEDAKAIVKHNYETVLKTGVEEVFFSCSGCFSTFTLEYARVIGQELGFKLYHLTQFVLKTVKEKGLKIIYSQRTKEDPLIITYHDPCHLGRYCEVYEEPRELLRMIEGVKLLEMKHNREMSWCCGAGGGVKALYGDIAGEIGRDRLGETRQCMVKLYEDRLKEAVETTAEVLVSSCVFCKNNLFQAASEDNAPIKVMDISQLLMDCEFYKES